jgi:spermidine synthase
MYPALKVALLCLFFLSGFSGLVYEVAWSRLLVHIFGATLLAVSTVLAVFMAGLAAGAYLAGRFGRAGNPLLLYAALELATGLYALAVPVLFSQTVLEPIWLSLHQLFVDRPLVLSAVQFGLAACGLAMPTACMGATFPVAARILGTAGQGTARNVGYLYAANTAGAMTGAVTGGFWWLPAFGLSASVAAAALLNLVVAGGAFVACRAASGRRAATSRAPAAPAAGASVQEAPPAAEDGRLAAQPLIAAVLVTIAATGALFMILEVCWTRFFSLVLGSTTYAFSAVLALVLLGLAAGSLLASAIGRSGLNSLLFLAFSQLLSGLYVYVSLSYFNEMPWWLIELGRAFSGPAGQQSFAGAVGARTLVAAAVVVPAAVFSGAVFPLCVRVAALCQGAIPVGQIYACNTAGAIVGSWLAGFVLMPLFGALTVSGIQASLVVVASCQTALAAAIFLLWLRASPPGALRPASGAGALVLCGLVAASFTVRRLEWNPALISSGVSFFSAAQASGLTREQFLRAVGAAAPESGKAPEIRYYREGRNTTVTVGTNPAANVTYLKNDGRVEVSVPSDPVRPAPTSDLATQVLMGLLPVLLHPEKPDSVFLLGYGSGTTAGAILACPEAKRLTIAELEEAVLGADRFFTHVNGRPLRPEWASTGRVRALVADGRSFLSSFAGTFDAVVSQPADPSVNGMSDLFTREFFRVASAKVGERGLMSQWLQLYSITPRYLGILCRTFRDAFPSTLMFHPPRSGEVILLGARQPITIDVGSLKARLAEPRVRTALMRAGVRSVEDLLAGLVAGPAEFAALCDRLARQTGDSRLNTDDNLITEYELPRQLFAIAGVLPSSLNAVHGEPVDYPSVLSNYGTTARQKATFLSGLALALARTGEPVRLPGALSLADQAAKLAATPAALFARAEIQQVAGRPDLARLDRRRAIATAGRDPLSHLALAEIYRQQADSSRAESEYVAALSVPSVRAHLGFGRFLLEQGRPAEALKHFAQAGQLDSLSPEALVGQGLAYLNLGAPLAAETALRRSLALDPAQLVTRLNLGHLLCRTGRAVEGMEEFRHAARGEPDSALPYLFVIAEHARAGNWELVAANIKPFKRRASKDPIGVLIEAVTWQGLAQKARAEAALARYRRMTGRTPADSAGELSKLLDEQIMRCQKSLGNFSAI